MRRTKRDTVIHKMTINRVIRDRIRRIIAIILVITMLPFTEVYTAYATQETTKSEKGAATSDAAAQSDEDFFGCINRYGKIELHYEGLAEEETESGIYYEIYRDGILIDTVEDTAYTDMTVEGGNTYEYVVKICEAQDVCINTSTSIRVSTYEDMTVTGNVVLAEDRKVNSLTVEQGGTINLNGYTLTVCGDSFVEGTIDFNEGRTDVNGDMIFSTNAIITMENEKDYLLVCGNIEWSTTRGGECVLNEGTIELQGDFLQTETGFKTEENHVLILSGENAQNIKMFSGSKIAVVDVQNYSESGVLFLYEVSINTIYENGCKVTMLNGQKGYTLSEDTTYTGDFCLIGDELNLNGHTLHITGNLIQSDGTVNVNGGTLIIDGDYRLQGFTQEVSFGRLIMTNEEDHVLVKGNFINIAVFGNDSLTEGVFEIKGDMIMSPRCNPYSFAPKGNHVTAFTGEEVQNIKYEVVNAPGAGFAGLDFNNTSDEGVIITGEPYVSGNVNDYDTVITGAISTTKTTTYTDNVYNGDIKIMEGMGISGTFTINGDVTAKEQLSVSGKLQVNGNFTGENNLILFGNMQVDGDFYMPSGAVYMVEQKAYLYVGKDFIFTSPGTVGFTFGTAEVKGDVYISRVINANMDHRLLLSGESRQILDITGNSTLGILEITNDSQEGVCAVRRFVYHELILNECRLTYGDTQGVLGWTLSEDTTIEGDLVLAGSELNLNGYTLTVNGNLIQPNGTVNVNGGNLIVNGDYRIQSEDGGESYGRLQMGNREDYVLVMGDFVTSANTKHTYLVEYGILEVKGNVTQDGTYSSKNFYISSTGTLLLSGDSLQTISFDTTAYDKSFVGNLVLANTSEEGIVITNGLYVDYKIEQNSTKVTGDIHIGNSTFFAGNQYTGNVIIDRMAHLRSDVTINGDVTCKSGVYIHGNVHINGNLKTESSLIMESGALYVSGNYENTGIGLNMKHDEDYVYIGGNLSYTPASESKGLLTAGTLEVAGDITITRGFMASAGHRLLISGDSFQRVDVNAKQEFGIVEIQNTSKEGVLFVVPLNKKQYILNGCRVSYGDGSGISGYSLDADTVLEGDITLMDGDMELNGYTLTIKGNLTQEGGVVLLGGGALIIDGDYEIKNNGILSMTTPGDAVEVLGDFTMASAVKHTEYLSEGELRVHGNFTADESVSHANFVSTGNHTVVFCGSAGQRIELPYAAGAEYSHFNNLVIENTSEKGVTFTEASYVTGDVTVIGNGIDEACQITGGITVSPSAAFSKGYFSGDVHIRTEGVVLKNVTVGGNLNINADVVMAGGVTVMGDCIIEEGSIALQNGNASVCIHGDVINSRYQEEAVICYSMGTCDVKGDISAVSIITVTNAGVFILSGDRKQNVSFAEGSYFARIGIMNTSKEGVYSDKVIQNDGLIMYNCPLVYGDINGVWGFTLQHDYVIEGDLNLIDKTLDLNGHSLTVKGNLVQNGAAISINGGTLNVGGSFDCNGKLEMSQENDTVIVDGDFNYNSVIERRKIITDGILKISGDFNVMDTSKPFHADEDSVVELAGSKSSSVSVVADTESGIVSVTVTDPVIYISHLVANKEGKAKVTFNTDINVTKSAYDESRNVTGTGVVVVKSLDYITSSSWSGSVHLTHNDAMTCDKTFGGTLIVAGELYTRGYTLESKYIEITTGSLYVENGAVISLQGMDIRRDGGLYMTDEAGTVTSCGYFKIAEKCRGGEYLAGTLDIKGDFYCEDSWFKTSGTHTTVLSGVAGTKNVQILQFENRQTFANLVLHRADRFYNCNMKFEVAAVNLIIDIIDIAPPTAVTDLTATTVAESSVTIHYTLADDDTDIECYNIYRDDEKVGISYGDTYTDKGLIPDSTYTYTVYALDICGNLAETSPFVTVTTPADTQAPEKTTGLMTATRTGSSITIEWNKAEDNVEVAGYNIYRDGKLIARNITKTTYKDTGLSTGIPYTYSVSAVDTSQNEGEKSDAIETYVMPPRIISMTPGDNTTMAAGDITITVIYKNAGNATGNTVLLELMTPDGWVNITPSLLEQNKYNNTQLYSKYTWDMEEYTRYMGNAGGECVIRATLTDADGNTDTCSVAYSIDNEAPQIPENIIATSDSGINKIYWDKSKSADCAGYILYRKTAQSMYTKIATIEGAGNTWYLDMSVAGETDPESGAGILYTYAVTAYDGFGHESGKSTGVTVESTKDTKAPVVDTITPKDVTISGSVTIKVASQDNIKVASNSLYYRKAGEEEWKLIGTNPASYGGSTFIWNTSELLEGEYEVKAVAADTSGNESSSDIIRKYTIDHTGPAAAQITDLKSTANSVTIKWKDAPEEDFAYYAVEQLMSDGNFTEIARVSNTLGYVVAGLKSETEYHFRVAGYDTLGNRGEDTGILTIATTADTTEPVIQAIYPVPSYYRDTLKLSMTVKDNVGVASGTFSVSEDGVNYTQVYTGVVAEGVAKADISYDMSLSMYNEGKIYIKFTAEDTSGNHNRLTEEGNEIVAEYGIDRTAPEAVTGLSVTSSEGYVGLAWNEAKEEDVSRYKIYRALEEEGIYRPLTEVTTLNYYDTAVTAGKTYCYRITAVDTAGNESEKSEEIRAMVCQDTVKPLIRGIVPGNGETVGPNTEYSVLVTDNSAVRTVKVYMRSGEEDTWTLVEQKTADSSICYVEFTPDTGGFTEGIYHIMVKAEDMAGNEGEVLTAQYSLDLTPPEAPQIQAENGIGKIYVTFVEAAESDTAYYELYRRKAGESEYCRIGTIGTTVYEDREVETDTVYYYKLRVYDIYGNYSESYPSYGHALEGDDEAPVARLPELIMGMTGMELCIDAAESTDNKKIAYYEWDFGDGTTATTQTARVQYVYNVPGNYGVTLKVYDEWGNTDTTHTTVTVREADGNGIAQITVTDLSGNPLKNAYVYLSSDTAAQEGITLKTDSEGKTTAVAAAGEYMLSFYAPGYSTREAEVTIGEGQISHVDISLEKGSLIVGELTVRRMEFNELVEAGVDMSNPENYHTFKVGITLGFQKEYIPTKVETVIGSGWTKGITFPGIGTGSGLPEGSGFDIQMNVVPGEGKEEEVLLEYLYIEKSVSWLKEMYEAELGILNTAGEQYVIEDAQAVLNLPEGISLAATKDGQSLTQKMGDIKGGDSTAVSWIIRGDENGTYKIGAEFTGTLMPFHTQIHQNFETEAEFEVLGGKGLHMYIYPQSAAYIGENYYVQFALINESDRTFYNLTTDFGAYVEPGQQSEIRVTDSVTGHTEVRKEGDTDSIRYLNRGSLFAVPGFKQMYNIGVFAPGDYILGTYSCAVSFEGDPEKEYYVLVEKMVEVLEGKNLGVEVTLSPIPSHIYRENITVIDYTKIFGDPVDITTGAFIEDTQTISVTGATTLSFDLNYNSLVTDSHGEMGYGWTHGYENYIINNNSSMEFYQNPWAVSTFVSEDLLSGVIYGHVEGRTIVVDEEAEYYGRYRCITAGMEDYYIEKEKDGSCVLYTPGETAYSFDTQGRLIRITATDGRSVSIEQGDSQITVTDDLSKKHLVIIRNEEGNVTRVRDDYGHEVTFSYTDGQLTGYTDCLGVTTTYSYDENNRITEVQRGDAVVVQNTYDGEGRVISQTNSLGNTSALSYEDTELGTITTLTDFDGNRTRAAFDSHGNLLHSEYPDGSTLSCTYDRRGNFLTQSDSYGNTVTYRYDDRDNIICITDEKGTDITFTYDDRNNLTAISSAQGVISTYEYDENNRMVRSVNGAGKATAYEYDSFGFVIKETTEGLGSRTYTYENCALTAVTDYNGNTSTVAYDGMGNAVKSTDALGNTTTYAYDALGRITAVTDALGGVTAYTYDENGYVEKITYPDGTCGTMDYDSEGNLLSVADCMGRTTSYTVDGYGEILSIQYPDGNTEQYEYDVMGNVVKATDILGNTTVYTYDRRGNVTSCTDSAGNRAYYEYYPNGQEKKISFSDGTGISYTYDGMGNLTEVTDEKGNTTVYGYDIMGNVVSVRDALGNTAAFSYDIYGRLISATDYNGNTTTYGYDAAGNCTTKTDAMGNVIRMEYDALNRMVSITAETKRYGDITVYYTYDAAGNLTSQTNERGVITYYETDIMGNVVSVTDGNGNKTAYTYNTDGSVSTITDSLGNVAGYYYDDMGILSSVSETYAGSTVSGKTVTYKYETDRYGRLISVTDPLLGVSSYTYDSLGNIMAVTDPNGGTTQYTYDSYSRVTAITDAMGNTDTYTYNAEGLLAEAVNARKQSTVYTYDALGRIISFTDGEGTVTYTYDANGNILTVTDKNGTIRRTYDSLNRVSSYTDYKGNTIKYSYDELGNLLTLTYPGGEIVRYEYNPDSTLKAVTDSNGHITSYEYDSSGRLIKTTNADGTEETCTYDKAGHLTAQTTVKGEEVLSTYAYTYDSTGNITQITGTDSGDPGTLGSVTMTYDKANRLVTYNGEEVVYDADGNMTYGPLDGVMTTFVYDCRNRLVQAGDTTYEYDAENVRTATETPEYREEYVTDKNGQFTQVLVVTRYEKEESAQEDAGTGASSGKVSGARNSQRSREYAAGTTTTYVYGKGLISEDSTAKGYLTYHYNHLGSTQYVTDTEGNKAYEFAYGTYGELTAGSAGEILFLYNGRLGVITDENGLYYMRTRYYNPDIKRFINQDVVSGSITNSQSLNRYAYVQGNPVSYTDPFGLSPYDMFSSWGHTLLDIVGFFPQATLVCNVVNAVWYVVEGNMVMAGSCLISSIPSAASFLGNVLNLAFEGTKYAAQIARASQYIIKSTYAIAGGATCFRGFSNAISCFKQAGNSELSISERFQYGLLGVLNVGIGTLGGYQCITNTVSLGKMIWQDTGSYIKSAVNSVKTYVKNVVSSVKSYVGGSSYKGGTSSINLPEYDGKTTHGVLVLDDGTQVPFSSGNANPNYKNYIPASHVEGKSAIYMRENGINNGTVFHNNTDGTCPYCDKMLPTLLEEGSTLTVVPPTNASAPKPSWVDTVKTYIGNDKIPKKPK